MTLLWLSVPVFTSEDKIYPGHTSSSDLTRRLTLSTINQAILTGAGASPQLLIFLLGIFLQKTTPH